MVRIEDSLTSSAPDEVCVTKFTHADPLNTHTRACTHIHALICFCPDKNRVYPPLLNTKKWFWISIIAMVRVGHGRGVEETEKKR